MSTQVQHAYANGYDMALRYNTDGLGITYIGLVIAWTCLLLPAAVFLMRNRHLPYLRIRNIPLAVSAVATLHVYWVLCMIAYVLNGYFPCATEYWIMSIYLPLGIALFQATNSQLLSVATAQKRYAHGDVLVESQPITDRKTPVWRKWWRRLKTYNATKNTMAWIGIGMSVQIFKNRKLETETREIIAEWEEKQKFNGSLNAGSTKAGVRSRASTRQSVKSTTSARQGEMYTMSALETTLKLNPTPLLMFSALKDFSGENISFLIHVRDWKAAWLTATPRSGMLRKQGHARTNDQELTRRQFQQAVGIYASFVSLNYSEFPINISSAHLRDLEAIFEQYAALVCAEPTSNAATPFENYWSSTVSEDLESQMGKDQLSVVSTVVGEGGRGELRRENSESLQLQQLKMTNFGERLPANIGIPDAFDEKVFDKAELSIKELVLTNTWAKFVKAGFAQNSVKSSFTARLEAVVDSCRLRIPSRLPKLAGKPRK
ncbi:putative gpcr-type protein [Fonsecaea pedrosoi]|nr:putative gpcr-type protein [Fonsecaea pedrosoi]